MSEPNDLVAKAQTVQKTFTGAGPLDGAEDFASNIENAFAEGKNIDATQLAIDGAGMVLDTAGAIMDPLGTLASSAVGWVIENVGWVREPFDDLMGDPAAVEAVANTWSNISKHLGDTASQHRGSMSQVSEWQGQSGQAYRKAGANLYDHVENASAGAASAAQKIKTAGAIVATTRALVRDLLAELAGTLITWGIGALATSVVSAGASVAAFVVRAVTKAVEIAGRTAQYLKKLFTALDKLGELAGSASGALRKRADDLAATAQSADSAVPGTGAQKLDNFTDAANTKADSLRERADGLSQKSADKWEESKRINHGTDMSALGHDAPRTRADQASDGPLGNTKFGQGVARFDEIFNKSSLDGQSVVRGAFSGDLSGHLAPSAGDAIAVGKEYGKEYNKAFHQEEEEKPNTPDGNRQQIGKYLSSSEGAQPHIVDDDKK